MANKKQEHTHDEDTNAKNETKVVMEAIEQDGLKVLGLIGDVDEAKSGDIIYSLLSIEAVLQNNQEKEKNLDFYISTHGGNAVDMFAIYDVMRQVKKNCTISTIGIGKVMSAGVLLLASGTKGHRKIGKHCRVMLHSVVAGNEGPIHNLENEMSEIRWTQERYTSALIKETKMNKTTIKNLMDKKVNVYLSAEEAVKYGIADQVI